MPSAHRARFACLAISLIVCRPARVKADFAGTVRDRFLTWDTNQDARLDLSELDHAIADPTVRGETAAAAVALRRAVRGATGAPGPITMAAFESMLITSASRPGAEPDADTPNATESDPDDAPQKPGRAPRLETLYQVALKRVDAASARKLFGDTGPSIEGIRQGRIGNCFCLAPLAAMVHRDPAEVMRRIKANSDDTYTVWFGETSITVPAPTDGEIALGNAESKTGIWVNVYEKAVGQSRQKKDASGRPTATPLATVSKGGSAGTQLSVLTGRAIQRFSCKPFRDPTVDQTDRDKLLNDLRRLAAETQDASRLIVCGTGAKVPVPGITSNHAYAVLKYDQKADTMTLWNPHANDFTPKGEPGLKNGYPVRDGVFTVPLVELVTFQGGFSFEQATPDKKPDTSPAAE